MPDYMCMMFCFCCFSGFFFVVVVSPLWVVDSAVAVQLPLASLCGAFRIAEHHWPSNGCTEVGCAVMTVLMVMVMVMVTVMVMVIRPMVASAQQLDTRQKTVVTVVAFVIKCVASIIRVCFAKYQRPRDLWSPSSSSSYRCRCRQSLRCAGANLSHGALTDLSALWLKLRAFGILGHRGTCGPL